MGRGFICCIDEGNLFAGSLFAGNLYESLNLRQVVFSKLPFCNVFLVNFSLPVAPMTRIWDELKPDITPGPRYLYWLVLWNMHFMTFPYIGNFIIPTDELHHFSEGLKPPTREYTYIYIYICFPHHVPFNSLDILDIFILRCRHEDHEESFS